MRNMFPETLSLHIQVLYDPIPPGEKHKNHAWRATNDDKLNFTADWYCDFAVPIQESILQLLTQKTGPLGASRIAFDIDTCEN